MTVRVDAAADYLSNNSISIADDAFTVCGWFNLTVDRNATGVVMQCLNAGATRYKAVNLATDGTSISLISSDFATVNGTNLSTGTWYHVALVASGANTYVYLNGVQDATNTDAAGATTYTVVISGSNSVQFMNGRIAYLKMWDAALTVAEVQQEMQTIRPQRFVNLYGWWPTFPGSTERARDYSGNARSFTENGTLTDEDPPPVSWGAPVLYVVGQPSAAPPSTVYHRLPLLGVG